MLFMNSCVQNAKHWALYDNAELIPVSEDEQDEEKSKDEDEDEEEEKEDKGKWTNRTEASLSFRYKVWKVKE